MSANRYITERNYFVLLVPFLYTYFSRMRGLRAFGFNAITLWFPGILLTYLIDKEDFLGTIYTYFAAYLVFISVYELGYLLNDTWGLRHDETPRRRIDIDYHISFFVTFFLIRIFSIVALSFWISVFFELWFWTILFLLSIAILMHNFVILQEIKIATFFQMSLMRFSIPIIISTELHNSIAVLFSGCIFFVLPRLLTYLDSKKRLRIPERKNPSFLMKFYLIFAPFVFLLSFVSGEALAIWVWLYFLTYACLLYFGRDMSVVRKIIATKEK